MASLRLKEILCLIYSALLFLCGALLIGFSVVLTFKLFVHFKFAPSATIGPFIVLFLLGFVHMFLTWLGVKGPTREHDFHIILFIAASVVLVIAEVIVGIWALTLWNEVDSESVNLMSESFEGLLASDYDKKDWVRLQSKLKCCGIKGPGDYSKKASIPLSCCNQDVVSNSTCPEIFNQGCKQPLIRYVQMLMVEATILGFVVGIAQIVGVVLYYNFLRSLREERAIRVAHRSTLQRENSNANTRTTPQTTAT